LFHNSYVFGSCIIHNLYTGCAKIKKIIPAPKLKFKIRKSKAARLIQNTKLAVVEKIFRRKDKKSENISGFIGTKWRRILNYNV